MKKPRVQKPSASMRTCMCDWASHPVIAYMRISGLRGKIEEQLIFNTKMYVKEGNSVSFGRICWDMYEIFRKCLVLYCNGIPSRGTTRSATRQRRRRLGDMVRCRFVADSHTRTSHRNLNGRIFERKQADSEVSIF